MSDFIHFNQHHWQAIEKISHMCQVYLLLVFDRFEKTLPKAHFQVQNRNNNFNVNGLLPSVQKAQKTFFKQRIAAIKKNITSKKIHLMSVDSKNLKLFTNLYEHQTVRTFTYYFAC